MRAIKQFSVLGMDVDVLVTSEAAGNSFSMSAYRCGPSDGPPPHRHAREDEFFTVLSGDFEAFNGSAWLPIPQGEFLPALRHCVHTFRNSGSAPGTLLSVVVPGAHDSFLDEISSLSLPRDVARLIEISERYGITYPTAIPGRNGNGHSPAFPSLNGQARSARRNVFRVQADGVATTLSGENTGDSCIILTQTFPPGVSTPMQSHHWEDVVFSVVKGEYEFFNGSTWNRLVKGDVTYALRGAVHAFRNCGSAEGAMQLLVVSEFGVERYLKRICGW